MSLPSSVISLSDSVSDIDMKIGQGDVDIFKGGCQGKEVLHLRETTANVKPAPAEVFEFQPVFEEEGSLNSSMIKVIVSLSSSCLLYYTALQTVLFYYRLTTFTFDSILTSF